MEGRFTSYGYLGRMKNGIWQLFATDTEYREAYETQTTEQTALDS